MTNTSKARPAARMGVGLATCLLALLSLAPAAGATKRVVDTIGGPQPGFQGGLFNLDNGAIAINHSGAGGVVPGTVYVAESKRVQQFTPSGDFVRVWGVGVLGGNQFEICENAGECLGGSSTPGPAGAISQSPQGISVDPATGLVYVADFLFRRVTAFSATGEPQGAFGWGLVDGSHELQLCTPNCSPASEASIGAGGELGLESTPDGNGIDIGPSSEIYVAGRKNRRVNSYQPTFDGATLTDVDFDRALGWDVVRSGPGDNGVNEEARLTVRATGGLFAVRISSQSGTSVPFNAPASGPGSLEEALNAELAPLGGSASVTGGPGDATGSSPYSITFIGGAGGDDIEWQAFSSLTGGSPSPAAILETTVNGGGAYEICVVADGDLCKRASTVTAPLEAGHFSTFLGTSGGLSPKDLALDSDGKLHALDLGGRQDEKQTLVVKATGGTFTLSFGGKTTDPIPYNAGSALIEAELEALSSIGEGGIRLIENRLEFTGDLVSTDVPAITCEAAGLNGGTCTVSTEQQGFRVGPRIHTFDPAGNPLDGNFGAAAIAAAFGADATLRFIAVDPDTDHLLVTGGGSETDGQPRVLELDGDGDAVALHGEGIELPDEEVLNQLRGLAAGPASAGGNLYLLTHSAPTLEGTFVLAEGPPEIDPLPSCATTTHLKGKVFSDGQTVGYHFEYLTEELFQADGWAKATRIPVTDVNVGPAPGAIEVSQQVTGLSGSEPHRFRLVATRQGASRPSNEVTCTTDPAVPALSAGGADVDERAAILKAWVNPQNEPTSYHFQYTTEAEFQANGWTGAKRAPDPEDASAGQAGEPTLVAQEVEELEPATAYRARIVATNETGTSEGAEQSFATLPEESSPPEPPGGCPNEDRRSGPSAQLPDCRAYELVSPPGAPNILGLYPAPISDDGDRVSFAAFGTLASGEQSGRNHYLASRDATGWSTSPLDIPFTDPHSTPLKNLFEQTVLGLSKDFGRFYLSTPLPIAPGDDNKAADIYLREPGEPIRPVSADASSPSGERAFVGNSVDGTHAVFKGADGNLWEYVDAEPPTLRIVNRLPDESVAPAPRAGNWREAGSAGNALGALSADGSRIFFESDTGSEATTRLWVREDGEVTLPVAGEAPGTVFVGASRDGEVVFFTTPAALDPGDTNGLPDLYRYDVDDDSYARLSVGGDPDPLVRTGLGVAVSDDGERVYFIAKGVLTEEPNAKGQSATDGVDNVYLHQDGAVEYVASPQSGPGSDNDGLEVSGPAGSVQDTTGPAQWDLSPNGSHLAFGSRDGLLPADTDSAADVYLYDATTTQLTLASTGPKGGNGEFAAQLGSGFREESAYVPSLLSTDGRFLFFQTAEQLVARDINDRVDVYERDLQSGRTWLISGGTAAADSELFGIDQNGASVLFSDFRRLSPEDTDGERSVYVARIGGGFDTQPPPPCAGEACKGAPPVPPIPPSADSSATVRGPGNVTPKPPNRRCGKGKRRATRAGKARCVRKQQRKSERRRARSAKRRAAR
jgi:hypothetical protein